MADRSVSVAVRADVSNYVAAIRTAQANTAAFTKQIQDSAKQRQALGQLGTTAGLVGVGAAAAVAGLVGAAANFDSAMSKIQAATHETSGNMDLLRSAAIQAGQATKYSASEAAGGIEALAKAGVNTKDILGGGLAGALSLAAAGNQSVADSAETAASAMTQFGLSGKDVPHIADLLAAGAGKAQGEVSDLAMALNQTGLVASQTGLSIEETTGALASFASAGLIGSDAGTSFKTMLLRLTPQGSKAAKTMDELGLSAYDSQGKFIGLANYAGVLHDKLAGMTDQQRQATLSVLFGQDAIRAANVLYRQGADGIQGWIDKTNDQGYAAATAAIKMDNLKGDIEQLRGSLETLFITTGEGAQGPLRILVQMLTQTTNALNGLPGPAKDAFLAMLALTALTGGAAWFGTKVVTGIANTRRSLDDLGVSAETTARATTLASTAFRSLGAIGIAIPFVEGLGAAIDHLEGSMNRAAPGTQELAGQLIALSDQKVHALGSGFSDLGDALKYLDSQTGGFNDLFNKVPDIIGVVPGVTSAHEHITQYADDIAALDQALTSIVQTGSPEQAQQAFESLAEAQGLSADQTQDLLNHLPGYHEALAAVANQTQLAAGNTEGFSGSLSSSVQAMQNADKAMEDLRKKARETGEQFFNIDKDLNNAKVSLSGWIREMQQSARDLENFTTNARHAAKRGLDEGLIASLEAAGPAGARRMRQLADATDAQIARANAAWRRGENAIKDYEHVATTVPPVKLRIDIGQVISGVAQATASVQHFINSWGSGGGKKKKHASGGLVVGPGSATSDDVGIQASNGEYVVRASSVRRYGIGAMNAINEGRPMSVASIATGARDGRTAAALEALNARLASLESIPAAVEAGAQRGSHSGSRQGLAAQGQAVFSQVGY